MGHLTLGPVFWALATLALAAATAYGLVFLRRPPSFARALVKTAFMAAGAGALIAAHAPFPLVLAIAAAAAGDFFLAFDKKWLLPLGILAFLFAQLLYTVMFVAIWFFSGDNAPLWPRYAAMAAIAIAVIGYLIWFWRRDVARFPLTGWLAVFSLFTVGALIAWYIFFATALPRSIEDIAASRPSALTGPESWGPLVLLFGALALAVLRRGLGLVRLVAMIYAGAITTMAVAAMWLPWVGWPAMVGALAFLLSDLVLATELFRLPADAPARSITAPVVWWSYVAAQTAIICGLLLLVLAN